MGLMKLWRIIAVATAAEAVAVSTAAGLMGLMGAWNGWLDVINQFAPIWLLLGLGGGGGMLALAPPGRARIGLLGAATAAVVVNLTLVGPDLVESIGDGFQAQSRRPDLKLVTFNVWSDNVDPQRTIDVILATQPDVVALQEEPGKHSAYNERLLQSLPFRTTCPDGSDLAIYSALSPTAKGCPTYPRPGSGMEFDRPIWIRLQARNGREVTVVTTHLQWPFPPRPRRAQLDELAGTLRSLPSETLILAGDFNLAPWSFAMRRQDRLLRPLLRRTHGISTWPARIGRVNLRMPFPILAIDQVYAGPGWKRAWVQRLPLAGSDHYGLAVSFYGDSGQTSE